MIEKVIYIAVDGKQFETKEGCLGYERMLEFHKTASALKNLCKTTASHCEDCPFFSYSDNICFFSDNPGIPAAWNFE